MILILTEVYTRMAVFLSWASQDVSLATLMEGGGLQVAGRVARGGKGDSSNAGRLLPGFKVRIEEHWRARHQPWAWSLPKSI